MYKYVNKPKRKSTDKGEYNFVDTLMNENSSQYFVRGINVKFLKRPTRAKKQTIVDDRRTQANLNETRFEVSHV